MPSGPEAFLLSNMWMERSSSFAVNGRLTGVVESLVLDEGPSSSFFSAGC
jgi:hypothetical protein